MLTNVGNALGWIVLWLVVLAGMGILFWLFRRERSRRVQFQTRIRQLEQQLNAVLELNRALAESEDEKSLIETALAQINRLVGGMGASFVPFDAWGEPLPAFTAGDLPEPVLKGWAEHLVSEQVRGACRTCEMLQSLSGKTCPLRWGPMGAMEIYCFPLALGERRLGMVNLYLPSGGSLDSALHDFLQGILNELALAVETARLHRQEVLTLRQIQALRLPRRDLQSTLSALLQRVRDHLGFGTLIIQVRPLQDERLSGLRIVIGDVQAYPAGWLEILLEQALVCKEARQRREEYGWVRMYPLQLPDGLSMGCLVLLEPVMEELLPAQQALLQTAAAQAALMIENERSLLALEYTLILQERTRLAREIHDGLAQTLAFLKMQVSQMQTALQQGDLTRLARLLSENKQVLEEVYQETRQTIDHLRTQPEEDLTVWLEGLASSFQRHTGIPVEVRWLTQPPTLAPEVQVQMVRILQEALNNVRKHAHASQVSITLREWGRDVVMEIHDNGRGFDPEDVPEVAQYGLRGMRERAEMIGAELQIISTPHLGTTVRVALPYRQEENVE